MHLYRYRYIICTFIFREGMCAWRECVYKRGLFKMTKCYLSSLRKSLHETVWQLFSFINATGITLKNLFCCYKLLAKNLSQTETHTHTHILGFLPASIDPFTPLKTKEAPPERKRGRGIWSGLQPSKRAQPGLPNALSPPLAWSSLKPGRGEKERE